MFRLYRFFLPALRSGIRSLPTNSSGRLTMTVARLLLVIFSITVQLRSHASTPTEAVSRRPNVLLVIVDDLGAGDLGCLGASDLKTPHLDQLFANSLRLNRFYANCPVCSPTRASVLTGHFPDRVGVPGVIRTHSENSWGYFQPKRQTLAEALQGTGYHTSAIGKWHLGLGKEDHPEKHGFDHFHGFLGDMMDDYFHHRRHDINYMRESHTEIDPEGHATDLFSQWASDFIVTQGTNQLRDDTSKPWFLYLAYNAPHTPIQPPDAWLQRVKEREPTLPEKRAKLVALIEHMDHGIGQVLQTLEESGQKDHTIVIFTSDNGGQINVGANNGPLRDGKGSMYEGGLRIPGCIRVPGHANTLTGQLANAPACTADLMPTLLEILDVPVPDGLSGRSLQPMLDNPKFSWSEPREIYFVRREGRGAYGGLTCEALLWGDWKLVHNLPTAPFEVFHLKTDPSESNDLAKKQPKRFRELQARIQRHIQAGGQVPWQKPVPVPKP